jgi:hypothetical protein
MKKLHPDVRTVVASIFDVVRVPHINRMAPINSVALPFHQANYHLAQGHRMQIERAFDFDGHELELEGALLDDEKPTAVALQAAEKGEPDPKVEEQQVLAPAGEEEGDAAGTETHTSEVIEKPEAVVVPEKHATAIKDVREPNATLMDTVKEGEEGIQVVALTEEEYAKFTWDDLVAFVRKISPALPDEVAEEVQKTIKKKRILEIIKQYVIDAE